MINKLGSISQESSVWDLHIHTCKCPKSSGDFKSLSVVDYVDGLLSAFASCPKLSMISFTDHNHISNEVYEEFLSRKSPIKLIYGIEVDAFLDETYKEHNDFKHIIFYFDDSKFVPSIHIPKINIELATKSPVLLNDFLTFLISKIKVPFLISPHFMKQESRSIDYDWDEYLSKENIDKYIDQMCCFWETSNNSNIQHAISFLEQFDRGNKVSVISFSDSNSFEKLTKYLKQPPQFFNSLPSFNGMRMVGSDCRRICFKPKEISPENRAQFIGKITQGTDNVIYFSDRLNTVIGGRGSGKSLLIDGLAGFLNRESLITVLNDQNRIDYIDNLNYRVFDMNGTDLKGHDFGFEYFNQGYVLDLFRKNSDLISSTYFKSQFDKLRTFNSEILKSQILQEIQTIKESQETINNNLVSIIERMAFISSEKHDVKTCGIKVEKSISYPLYSDAFDYLNKQKILPKELLGNANVEKKQKELLDTIYNEILKYNQELILENFYPIFSSHYRELISKINEKKKAKKDTIQSIKSSFGNEFVDSINRVAKINKILGISNKNFDDRDSVETLGFKDNLFEFIRSVNVEKIKKYLLRVFNDYFDSAKVKDGLGINKKEESSLLPLIIAYCFDGTEYIMESKSISDLDKELDSMATLKIDVNESIIYTKDGNKYDVKELSPGTKANILMEYIVFHDSGMPLLIDQPEDNIDNQTVYDDLTKWFTDLKLKRQVIVATHDANIVVNGDAENVIVCEQKEADVFDYWNGALEFDGIIDDVSRILDGGKDAIERRLLKYGK